VRGLVLVSALSRASLAAFLAHGFDAYLVKPVRPAAILAQLADDRAQTARNAAIAQSDTSLNKCKPALPVKCRVLVAEDNEINALLARRVIERTGGEVHWARNGHEAVSAMHDVLSGNRSAFDLILMDIFMPELDGLQAAATIRALVELENRRPGTSQRCPPIIALTANAFAEDRARYLESGMDDYLSKPFEKSDLEALLQRWISGYGMAA
jgi:CheY-like chemotaxis protein